MWPQEFTPGYKGMVATEDISEGELVAFIPRSMVMTWREAMVRQNLLEVADLKFNIRTDHLGLLLYILEEKRNPFSEWYDWI